ncbi:MAG TPA: DEAD/DEAH box helicase [Bacteroidales bacterium]|nr:DEAD/DEAH box helicase [Bacteroidales bacterium]
MNFIDFNFTSDLQQGLDAMGFNNPTPIQEQAIPVILSGKDLIACAQTGTGKTAAYLLPVIHKLVEQKASLDTFKCLIIVPTRELAMQIDQQVEAFTYFCQLSSISVYGGGEGVLWDIQKKALTEGVEIVIATPGRLIAHLAMGYIDTSNVQYLILDEADRMLDMGFHDDIVQIISYLPKERQTLLFSATMPEKIRALAKKIMGDAPEQISLAISKPAEGIVQAAYFVEDHFKIGLIKELLKEKKNINAIIFSSKKNTVRIIERELLKLGFDVASIHSDLEQKQREQALLDFRNRKLQILVGTDVVARGIDIAGIGLVLNYDVPPDAEDYIHRIGRTARAETTGVALTFVNRADRHKFRQIETFLEKQVFKIPVPKHFSTGEEVVDEEHAEPKKKFFKKRWFKKK